MFQRLMETHVTWATVPLRLALGLIFIAHGAQKVFGVWNGPGLARWVANPTPFAFMRPAWFWMGAAALFELIGGALILLGLLTRIGAAMILIVMLTAVFGVHWSGGFFLQNRGIEYAFALLCASLALLIMGGGRISFDCVLMRGRGRRR